MKPKRRVTESSGDSLMSIISFRYLPYWPLFAILALIFLSLAFVFTKYIPATYRISASIVIRDKEKGAEESQTLQSLNLYAGGKIVENEVLVLKSRTLMRNVVLDLHLYAPIFERGHVKPASAYLSSPVKIEVKNPEKLKEQKEIDFQFNTNTQQVTIGSNTYPLNQWINFPYATIRFVKNPERKRTTDRSLYFSLIDPRKVTEDMLKGLDVEASSKLSSVVNIQYTDEIPERGENVVNGVLNAYTHASIQNSNQLAANTLTFVTDRVRLLESELDSINQRIQEFRSTEGVVDLSEQGKLYLQNVSENDRKASDINMQLAIINQVERHVRAGGNRTGIVPTTLGIDDPVLSELLTTLNGLELEYARLRNTTGENNPLTQAVESEIQKIRPNILSIVRNQRLRLQASRNNLNATTGRFNSMISTIPRKERELLDISREQAIKNDVYAFLLQRKEEAELSSASTIADSRIVDRAEASVTPVASQRVIILIGAFIAAVALTIAYVFYREGLTSNVLFRSAIERATTFPVIAEIAHIKKRKNTSPHLLPNPVISTQFKQLQAALGLFNGMASTRKILVTSSIDNEGKTFVSNQLAISLATASQRVLLLDLNLYTSETSNLHQLANVTGFSDYILDKAALEDVIYETDTENLFVLPAGGKTRNTTELLIHSRMQELFRQIGNQYDFIIMDTSPIELTTDAYLVSKHADASLYVIRQRKTPNTMLQKLDRNHKLESLPGLSIVFNDVRSRGFLKKYFGYGYGYGYENVNTNKSYSMAA